VWGLKEVAYRIKRAGDEDMPPVKPVSLNDEFQVGEDLLISDSKLATYIHVDDCIAFGGAGSDPATASKLVARAVERLGFRIPFIEHDSEVTKVVGYCPELTTGRWLPPRERLVLLDDALEFLVGCRLVAPDTISRVLGHWQWAALLRRSVLCIPFVLHKFVAKFQYDSRPRRLSPAGRLELKMMRATLPTLWGSMAQPFLPAVAGADASGFGDETTAKPGFGAGFTLPEPGSIVVAGLQSRQVGRDQAKPDLLLSKRYTDGEAPLAGAVPPAWLEDDAVWVDLVAGEYKYKQHIDELEYAAQLQWLEILGCTTVRNARCVSLCDSGAASSILGRGRARVQRLNRLSRRKMSLELVTELRLLIIQVASARMPMDRLSRTLELTGPVTTAREKLRASR
jgi:hypothetical protein